jgi:hypothetical protein
MPNDSVCVDGSGKTQTLRAWDACSSVLGNILPGVCRVRRVLRDERTVGIEIHDMDVQGKRTMVWDHGGQLEVRCGAVRCGRMHALELHLACVMVRS